MHRFVRTFVYIALAALLFAGCSIGGKRFALMSGSLWRVASDGTAYALETRPGNEGIVWRIDGDWVSEELSAPANELTIVGLLGDDLVVRRGGADGELLLIAADGGSRTLTASGAAGVADAVPASCGLVSGVSDGAAVATGGCRVGAVSYLFSDAGLLFRVADGVARAVETEGRVVELWPLGTRAWVGVIATPPDVVHYTAIDEQPAQ